MILTARQEIAKEIVKKYQHILLYGGSRSGKTFLLILLMCIRAFKYPNSRHIILRQHFNHCKISIWLDTLPKVLENFKAQFIKKESDYFIKFYNGSELWIDGLDDKDRVEKILGREYNTIFYNEISQIPYNSITTTLTRLSKKNDGLNNKAFYDCNPVGKSHWSYKLFITGVDPQTEQKKDVSNYGSIMLNPRDNTDNISKDYIENILEQLPENKRKRFLLGEWADMEGLIFNNWKVIDSIPDEVRKKQAVYGQDYGFSIDPTTLIQIWDIGDDLYINELIYQTGLTNQLLIEEMRKHIKDKSKITGDSSEPKTIDEISKAGFNIHSAIKGADSVRFGIDYLQSKKNIYITKSSTNTINEFSSYCWKVDRNGKSINEPVDDFNHSIDSIRYGIEDNAIRKRKIRLQTGSL